MAARDGGKKRRMESQSEKMPPSVGRRVSGVPVIVLTQLRSPDQVEESMSFSRNGRASFGSFPLLIRVIPLISSPALL
jgi:hypothetical protein